MPTKKTVIYRKTGNRNRNRKRYYKRYRNKKKYQKIETTLIRQPGVIVADRHFCKLRYTDQTSNLLSIASNYGLIRYYANNVFDANPLILTSSVPGFTELASLYERFRVRACKVKLTACNQEAFPVVVMTIPTNYDIAGSLSHPFLQELLDNPYCKYKALSAKGGQDKCTISNYITMERLFGTKNVKTDEAYAGYDSANPGIMGFMNLCVYSMNATNFTTASVPFEARMTYYVEFFQRKVLTT